MDALLASTCRLLLEVLTQKFYETNSMAYHVYTISMQLYSASYEDNLTSDFMATSMRRI